MTQMVFFLYLSLSCLVFSIGLKILNCLVLLKNTLFNDKNQTLLKKCQFLKLMHCVSLCCCSSVSLTSFQLKNKIFFSSNKKHVF